MSITFDPRKRDETLVDRGLDFATAAEVFDHGTVDIRIVAGTTARIGSSAWVSLRDRMVIVVWTRRGEARHVISMRKPMDESKRDIPIDLARIDAHVISDREYEEIPELTDEDFARGVWVPGRNPDPAEEGTAFSIIDADVLARFRASGPGWEDRVKRILRDAAESLGAG